MGYKALIGCGQSSLDTVLQTNNGGNGFTAYGPVGGVICTSSYQGAAPTGTAASGTLTNYSAHTASGMQLRMSSTTSLSATINLFLNVNGVQGNQLIPILSNAAKPGNYTTGAVISDLSHSDAVPANVTLSLAESYVGTGLSGQAIFTGLFWQADQPGGVCIPLSASVNAYNFYPASNGLAARWIGATGGGTLNSGSVSQAQVAAPTSGLWSNLQANIFSGPGDTAAHTRTLKSCVSATFLSGTTATFGNQIITIPGNTGTGIVNDLSHTDSVPSGFFINYEHDGSSGETGTITYSAFGSTWTSSAPNVTPLLSAGTPAVGIAGTLYPQFANSPRVSPGTIEGISIAPTSGTFSGMTFTTTIATTGSPTFSFSIDGATTGNQTGVIGSTPGVVQDLSHTDTIVVGHGFSNSLIGFGSGFSMASQSVAFTTPAPGGGARQSAGMTLMGVG